MSLHTISDPKVKVNSTASTLLHRLVLFLELGTVQTGTGKVGPAWKFKCTTAASEKGKIKWKNYLKVILFLSDIL